MLKPLTNERRAEILQLLLSVSYEQREAITELLAAEACWREAVKNTRMVATCRDGCCLQCPCCGEPNWKEAEHGHDRPPFHQPDCPWVKAQE